MRTDEKPDLVFAVVRLCTAAGVKVNGGGGAAGLIESVAVAEIAGGELRDRELAHLEELGGAGMSAPLTDVRVLLGKDVRTKL